MTSWGRPMCWEPLFFYHKPSCAPRYQLNAASVGRPVHAENLSEEEVQLCMLCVLRALKALHGSHDEEGKGLVHRDLRWPNVVRCSHLASGTTAWTLYYKLIDLETVAREGQVRGISSAALQVALVLLS